jgi:hypothetical protein
MAKPIDLLFNRYQEARTRFLREPTAGNVDDCIAILEQAVALPSHPAEAEVELALRLAQRARIAGASPDIPADARRAGAFLKRAERRTVVSPVVRREVAIGYRAAFLSAGQRADADQSLALLRSAATASASPDPDTFQQLIELSEEVWDRTRDPAALDNVIDIYQQADASMPGLTGDQRAWLLDQRALRLVERFRLRGRSEDAVEALANRRRALTLASPDSPDRARLAYGLALSLEDEAERAGRLAPLEESIAVLSAEIGRLSSADRAPLLSRRGVAGRMAYRFTGAVGNLDAAVNDQEAALAAGPVSGDAQALYQIRLSNALAERYLATGEDADLDAAVTWAEAAIGVLSGRPAEDPGMADNALGQALGLRYERYQRPEDLDASLAADRAAIAAAQLGGSESLGLYLNNLADTLIRHEYPRTGRVEVLNESVEILTEAESLQPPLDDLAMVRNTHGLALLTRYEANGDPSDLHEAVLLTGKAVDLTPENEPRRPMRLQNWATALLARASLEGNVQDAEQALAARRAARALVPPWSHNAPNFQVNLAAALVELYNLTGRRDCLAEAEEICARISPAGLASWRVSILINSAVVLMAIADASGTAAPLAEAARRLTDALDQSGPDDPTQAIIVYNLAAALQNQAIMNRRPDLVAATTTRLEAFLGRLPADHPVRKDAELALANSYRVRGLITSTPSDLAAAVAFGEKALAAQAAGTLRWFNAALRLSSFYRSADSSPERADELLARVLADSPVPGQVINAARHLGDSRAERGDLDAAAAAYIKGVRATEALFDRQFTRTHHEQALQEGLGLVLRAAITLASAGRPGEAIAILESGRTILADTALHATRRRLEALTSAGHGDLASEYQAAAARLGDLTGDTRPSTPDAASHVPGAIPAAETIRAAMHRLRVAIERISAIPGFETFPRPRPLDAADLARLHTPCVYLVPGPVGGAALLINDAEAVARPLPGLNDEDLEARAGSWRQLVTSPEARARSDWPAEITSLGDWLWATAMGTVTEMLGDTDEVIVIPCGKLVDLPLHAARRPGPGGSRYLVQDLTIRYSPNLRTVLDAATAPQAPAAQNLPAAKLLVVADETLRHAPEEATAIAAAFDRSATSSLQRSRATHGEIMEALAKANVAHFACHAVSNPIDPLASSIDSCRDSPVTLADILQLELPITRLAVLSGCATAASGQNLPDEVINLASGLVQAGVTGVIGSLWPVEDATTASLMKRFYQLWRSEGTHPAAALCQAQAWMCSGKAASQPGASRNAALPSGWAPFIYVGS